MAVRSGGGRIMQDDAMNEVDAWRDRGGERKKTKGGEEGGRGKRGRGAGGSDCEWNSKS